MADRNKGKYQGKDRENRQAGPSGKPMQHKVQCNGRGATEEAARRGGQAAPVHHTAHEPGQRNHYHPTNEDGSIKKWSSLYLWQK